MIPRTDRQERQDSREYGRGFRKKEGVFLACTPASPGVIFSVCSNLPSDVCDNCAGGSVSSIERNLTRRFEHATMYVNRKYAGGDRVADPSAKTPGYRGRR